MQAVAAVVLALLSVGLLWYAWREISAIPEETERSSGLQHRMRPPEEPPEPPDEGVGEALEEEIAGRMAPGPPAEGSAPTGREEPGPGAEPGPAPGTSEELARGLFGDEPPGEAEAPEEQREQQEEQERTAPGPDVGPLGSEAAEPPEERDVAMGLPEYVPPEGREESADGEAPAEEETTPGDEHEVAGAEEEAAAEETAPLEAPEAGEAEEERAESGPSEPAGEAAEEDLEEGREERDDEEAAAGQEPVEGPANAAEPLPDQPDEEAREARDRAEPAADQERPEPSEPAEPAPEQERAEPSEPAEPSPEQDVEAAAAAAAGAAAASEAAGAGQPGPADVDYELHADESDAGRGFRVRPAPGGDPIPWRSLPLEEGLLAFDVAGVRDHLDVAQLAEFAPGEPIRLVPEDGAADDEEAGARPRVAVYDGSREYRVGHVPEDRSELVAELIRADPGYRGVALWETTEEGQVVGLRVLITASDASIRLPGDPPD